MGARGQGADRFEAPDEIATVDVLGVPVACLGLPDLLEQVAGWTGTTGRRTVAYVNAHCLNLAQSDPAYRRFLQSADLVYADGISVVWAARLLGGCRLVKMTGADWIMPFCALAAAHGLRIYILAGKPGLAAAAAEHLHNRFPGLQIVAARDGYFSELSAEETATEIQRLQPDVLFVGMGAPRQELWLAAHQAALGDGLVCWTVGALFDYVAGAERRVPPWMYRLGLEWLWRLVVDPWGKWKRYLLGNPLFLARVLRQVVHQRLKPGS